MQIANGLFKAYAACKRGATAIEYGLILALMGVALIGALTSTGGSVDDGLEGTANSITAAMASQAGGAE